MIRRNLLANFVGQGWVAVISIVLVPAYVRYLGIEAYGLVGLFALMQSWMQLLDVGLSPMLSREMGRFSGGAHDINSVRTLLRTVELVGAGIATLGAFIICAASPLIARYWLTQSTIDIELVRSSIFLMGIYIGLRFIEGLYRATILGLQKHVELNIALVILTTLRGFGAVFVLKFISPTIIAFFAWQIVVSAITVFTFWCIIRRHLPGQRSKVAFSFEALNEVKQFSLGVFGITLSSLLLTQIDKLILSKVISLESFGYYTFAASAAGSWYLLVLPVTQTFYPKLCELRETGDQKAQIGLFHRGAQMISVFGGTFALCLIYHADTILQVWTSNPTLVAATATLFRIMLLGNLINGLMLMPYQLQLAHGWTKLSLKLNMAVVLVLTPAILVVAPVYGAIGAATIWVVLNTIYLLVGAQLMFRRLLITEKWRWYVIDVAWPLFVGLSTLILADHLFRIGAHSGVWTVGVTIFASLTAAIVASAFSAPEIRIEAFHLIAMIRSRFSANAAG